MKSRNLLISFLILSTLFCSKIFAQEMVEDKPLILLGVDFGSDIFWKNHQHPISPTLGFAFQIKINPRFAAQLNLLQSRKYYELQNEIPSTSTNTPQYLTTNFKQKILGVDMSLKYHLHENYLGPFIGLGIFIREIAKINIRRDPTQFISFPSIPSNPTNSNNTEFIIDNEFSNHSGFSIFYGKEYQYQKYIFFSWQAGANIHVEFSNLDFQDINPRFVRDSVNLNSNNLWIKITLGGILSNRPFKK